MLVAQLNETRRHHTSSPQSEHFSPELPHRSERDPSVPLRMLRVILDRMNRTYHPEENVTGVILVESEKPISHYGLNIDIEGVVNMQYAASRNVSLWDSMMNTLKPIEFLRAQHQLEESGRIPAGGVEIPFSFPLKPTSSFPLYESYHGVYLSVRYRINVELVRGFFASNLKRTSEFIVHVPGQGCLRQLPARSSRSSRSSPSTPSSSTTSSVDLSGPGALLEERVLSNEKTIEFEICPDVLENVRKKSLDLVPNFTISGVIDSLAIDITKPLLGRVRVMLSAVDIKSIELQLVRVETCVVGGEQVREATEIQNLQIGEGNVVLLPDDPNEVVFYSVRGKLARALHGWASSDAEFSVEVV